MEEEAEEWAGFAQLTIHLALAVKMLLNSFRELTLASGYCCFTVEKFLVKFLV